MPESSADSLSVVLCWHMHQPCYLRNGRFARPWVYLHAIKDYTDMARHIAAVPGARAVVNFSPVLIEQLEQYRRELNQAVNQQPITFSDPLLQALHQGPPQAIGDRAWLLEQCFLLNEKHMLSRHPPYRRLQDIVRSAGTTAARYLSDDYLNDLVVWYHIAWLGEHVRRDDDRVHHLMAKGEGFTVGDRKMLLAILAEEIAGVLPRYRRLAEQGQIELSVSPWSHPILPLVIDLEVARESLPHLELPDSGSYPGGKERARWQLEAARRAFEQTFGTKPNGCWPSEGAISAATLALIEQTGFKWCASSDSVLENSLAHAHQHVRCRHQPFAFDNQQLSCFFRDDRLSDLIGFTYQSWSPADAVENLIGHIENIARHCEHPDAVVSIVLDGENAWEHYPENGYTFLRALYQGLARHPAIRLTTFSDHLAQRNAAPEPLRAVVAGSWVHGTLSTWIGNPDKNAAWSALRAAKSALDEHCAALGDDAARQLAICEGSDWFWWLGDDNATWIVHDFEQLFREHLVELYGQVDERVPGSLRNPLSHGAADAGVHTMRPT